MQNRVLMSVIWNDATGNVNRNLLATTLLQDWFGVQAYRVKKLVGLASRLHTEGYKATEHGMEQ